MEAFCVAIGIIPIQLDLSKRLALYWLRKYKPEIVREILQQPAETKRIVREITMEKWQEEWSTN